MCFNSNFENLPRLCFDGVQFPYTDSFNYLGKVCNKQTNLNTTADAALRPFTAGMFRNITLLTGYTGTYGFSRHTLFLLVCMQVRFGPLHIFTRQRDVQSPT